MDSVFGTKAKTIEGREIDLRRYEGKVLLAVNVASRCGFTPQYRELQALYEKYKERGFMILGFPCDDFLNQEPAGNMEILGFCKSKYNVTFDLFQKIKILGNDVHPLYRFLQDAKLPPDRKTPWILHLFRSLVFFIRGLPAPVRDGAQWNFQKFLLDKQGRPVAVFSPMTQPSSPALASRIEEELNK